MLWKKRVKITKISYLKIIEAKTTYLYFIYLLVANKSIAYDATHGEMVKLVAKSVTRV